MEGEGDQDHPFLTARHIDDLTDATRILNRNVVTLAELVRESVKVTKLLISALEGLTNRGGT